MSFEELNLNKPLQRALSDLEYVYPTPIQKQAFSVVMSGRDVVGIAQTGTGKTFAYLLPLLRQLPFSEQKDPRVLILVPTRELVLQIVEEIQKLTKYVDIRSAGVYGGANINTQKQVVYNGLDIIVATPGRLLDLLLTGVLRLKSVQKLVIDEVEEMLDPGFRSQLIKLLEALPTKRQNLLFSATLTKDHENLIANFFNNPQKIEVTPHGTPIEKIIQKAYHVPNFNTKASLIELLLKEDDELSKVLVFVNTIKMADRLHEQIEKLFPDQIGVIHSRKSHNNRINAVKKFEDGLHRVLIATDIIARGLDIIDVSHVFNFDIPEVPGDYIHRIGRTGRADKDGVAITFINESEKASLYNIEQLMNRPIAVEPLPKGLVISKVLIDEEKPVKLFDKDYLKSTSIKDSQGAFHEKKDKNKKVNLGGPKIRKALNEKLARQRIPKKPAKVRF